MANSFWRAVFNPVRYVAEVAQRHANRGGAMREAMERQTQAYERQIAETRGEARQMNERIQRSQEKVNKGVARSNRARARGGIFGDAGSPQQSTNLNPRLG